MLKMTPVKFEFYDTEMKDLVFTVEEFDETTASINIKTLVTLESWDELAPLIRQAIVALDLE